MTLTPTLRHILPSLTVAFTLAVGCLTFNTAASANDQAAEAFVNDIATRAIAIISDKSADNKARQAAFGKMLDENADMQKIAAFALGQYVRLPTPEQKAEYLDLVRNFVVKVYVTRLSDYNDEKLTITGSQTKGSNQAIVNSQINFTNGREPVKVTWWLIKEPSGSYKIFDVNVVGIWLAQEQRSTFTSVIANHDGKFTALLDHLKSQITVADNGN
jgi:phospholipid transport system substrate-binding protein